MAIQAVSGTSSYDTTAAAAASTGASQAGAARGPKPAGGPPPGGGAAKTSSTEESSSSSNKIYDVKDTDKDGTVSSKEEIAYLIAHPEEAEIAVQAQTSTNYDQLGKPAAPTGLQSMLNTYA